MFFVGNDELRMYNQSINQSYKRILLLFQHVTCHQDSTTHFFIWMMTALKLHSGQGVNGGLLDAHWPTPDQVNSDLPKNDHPLFGLALSKDRRVP